MAASIKNSKSILERLAPMAFFKPIMLVLSFTVTNIILAIPNMPTIRLITPINPPTISTVPNKPLMAWLNASTLFNEKLSSWVGLNLLIWRMAPCNSTLNCVGVTLSLPFAISTGLLNSSEIIWRANL